MNRRVFTVGAIGVLGGCLSQSGVGQTTRTEHRTHDVDVKTELRVHNRNGVVTVAGYGGDRMETDIEIRGPSAASVASVSVDATRTANGLTLVTKHETDQQRASVDLTIRYPDDAPVEQVQTSNGPIEITDTVGDLDIESHNGALSVQNVDGVVSMATDNGAITAREVATIAGANTSNGSIEIDVPAITGDVTIQTTNGPIDAALASDLDAAVSASTSNSTVTLSDLELTDERGSNAQTNVAGSLGSGTHELSFETSNGPIDLRALSNSKLTTK